MSREFEPRKKTPMMRGFHAFSDWRALHCFNRRRPGAKASQAERQARESGVRCRSQAESAPLDPQLAIQMANDYFNTARVMTADFVQIGADGRRSEGKLYVLKPGRLRFEYALPATMEIIADGVSVAIRDRKLKSQQLYFISQTPLKFLLQDKLNLAKDVKVTNVSSTDSTL